ncbi:MAG: hypothetical protein EZS28_020914 [Streblomastix strix]|uniref:Uncharacterized protein n=2 Tax=Streblomastix strix TaxID=222440 RepID=A0A5J4VML4_9EUKA|nr:MAG: hypothetical protein EZS28_020914 [Streblomastix strix]
MSAAAMMKRVQQRGINQYQSPYAPQSFSQSQSDILLSTKEQEDDLMLTMGVTPFERKKPFLEQNSETQKLIKDFFTGQGNVSDEKERLPSLYGLNMQIEMAIRQFPGESGMEEMSSSDYVCALLGLLERGADAEQSGRLGKDENRMNLLNQKKINQRNIRKIKNQKKKEKKKRKKQKEKERKEKEKEEQRKKKQRRGRRERNEDEDNNDEDDDVIIVDENENEKEQENKDEERDKQNNEDEDEDDDDEEEDKELLKQQELNAIKELQSNERLILSALHPSFQDQFYIIGFSSSSFQSIPAFNQGNINRAKNITEFDYELFDPIPYIFSTAMKKVDDVTNVTKERENAMKQDQNEGKEGIQGSGINKERNIEKDQINSKRKKISSWDTWAVDGGFYGATLRMSTDLSLIFFGALEFNEDITEENDRRAMKVRGWNKYEMEDNEELTAPDYERIEEIREEERKEMRIERKREEKERKKQEKEKEDQLKEKDEEEKEKIKSKGFVINIDETQNEGQNTNEEDKRELKLNTDNISEQNDDGQNMEKEKEQLNEEIYEEDQDKGIKKVETNENEEEEQEDDEDELDDDEMRIEIFDIDKWMEDGEQKKQMKSGNEEASSSSSSNDVQLSNKQLLMLSQEQQQQIQNMQKNKNKGGQQNKYNPNAQALLEAAGGSVLMKAMIQADLEERKAIRANMLKMQKRNAQKEKQKQERRNQKEKEKQQMNMNMELELDEDEDDSDFIMEKKKRKRNEDEDENINKDMNDNQNKKEKLKRRREEEDDDDDEEEEEEDDIDEEEVENQYAYIVEESDGEDQLIQNKNQKRNDIFEKKGNDYDDDIEIEKEQLNEERKKVDEDDSDDGSEIEDLNEMDKFADEL